MSCNGCPYKSYDYQEGYPNCKLFGDDEDYIYENKKGELGCRFNQRSLQKYIKIHELEEEEIVRQMGDFADWCKEQELKETQNVHDETSTRMSMTLVLLRTGRDAGVNGALPSERKKMQPGSR